MNYLDLVNKLLQESGAETNSLTSDTWNSEEAGRRMYPRAKRLVAEAWKMIQMSRFEWEFKSAEMFQLIYPRFKVRQGQALTEPVVGTKYRGELSNFEFTVRQIIYEEGSWEDGTWQGQLELTPDRVGVQPIPAEIFNEITTPGNSSFMYTQKGSYDFTEYDPLLREIQWETFVAFREKTTPTPVQPVPWNNWLYKDLAFTQGSRTVPAYISQDYEGNIVFYPQTLDPFYISFIYNRSPQMLTEWNDVPGLLREEYHDWIAWLALINWARYDKNTSLAAYATPWTTFYERRAERELMPRPEWGQNKFDMDNT